MRVQIQLRGEMWTQAQTIVERALLQMQRALLQMQRALLQMQRALLQMQRAWIWVQTRSEERVDAWRRVVERPQRAWDAATRLVMR